MALSKRTATIQDGLSKKHDLPLRDNSWTATSRLRPWLSFRRRRVFLTLITLIVVYFFIKYLPTDVPPMSARYDIRTGQFLGQRGQEYGLQNDLLGDASNKLSGQIYDGPLKFYNLAASLRPHIGIRRRDRVLVTVSNLDSVSIFLPFVCEMALHNRSDIHVAFMDKSEAKIDAILSVNGISQLDCPLFWHDARPDYPLQSSDQRRSLGVKSGLAHLHSILQPQVLIVDEMQSVDTIFKQALDEKANALELPITVLPTDIQGLTSWVSLLGATSLAVLDKLQIEIVIHPYSDSAGSLLRLLQSLQAADYTGFSLPRITVELPSRFDPFVTSFLEQFQWPPNTGLGNSKLSIRRRIKSSQISPAEATLRTIESVYVVQPTMSHVLVLNPEADLAPSFYHVLMFLLLEYNYGQERSFVREFLMGISLHLPEKNLKLDGPFILPDVGKMGAVLLSQSPASNAALYLGNKWNELHTFLSRRLQQDPTLQKFVGDVPAVSTQYPAWLNQAHELMQARGYYMIYPSYGGRVESDVVTMHKELHQSPEEYIVPEKANSVKAEQEPIPVSLEADEVLGAVDEHPHANMHERPEKPASLMSLLFPDSKEANQARLPSLFTLPLFSSVGEVTDWQESQTAATKYSEMFSITIGECSSARDRGDTKPDSIDFLFCDPG